MVYKKFIVKNGKTYGPYIYHSKRVDGKVVSEYHGSKKVDYKFFFWIIFGVFLIGLFSFLVFNSKFSPTGNVALNLQGNYIQGEPFDGTVEISLKQGELLPTTSRVIVETETNLYEYDLSDLTSENFTSGNYYLVDKELSGNGEGFGIAGEKTIYPNVDFTLNIISASEEQTETPSEEVETNESTEPSEEVGTNETSNENPETNETSEIPETTENETTNEETESSEVEETPATTTEIISTSEDKSKTETKEEKESSKTSEETPATEVQTEESATEEQSETPIEETPASEPAPITGNIILRFFSGVTNFFLSLTPTGRVAENLQTTQLSGITSYETPFTHTLAEGESAELVSSSHEVNVKTEGSLVTVTTDYSESEEGFGANYLGEENKIITLNLSTLDLSSGNISVKLVYGDAEILSLQSVLTNGEIFLSNETILNETLVNETTNKTFETSLVSLTESELKILKDEFGENFSIEVVKAEKKNDRIIVKFKLENYWAEFSYFDKGNVSYLMERDRTKWLKDIARKLTIKESEPEIVSNLIGNYTINNPIPSEEQNTSEELETVEENQTINVENASSEEQ